MCACAYPLLFQSIHHPIERVCVWMCLWVWALTSPKKNWTVKHIGNTVHWWTKHFFDGLTLDSSTLIGSFRVVYAINLEENWYKHTNTYIQSFSFTQRVKWFNNLISQQPHTVQIWYREYKVLNVWIETDWT